jgi:Uma2 family endonuclease
VKAFWDVDAAERTVRVFRPDRVVAVLGDSDIVTLPNPHPGFSVRVADLFRLPGEPRPG